MTAFEQAEPGGDIPGRGADLRVLVLGLAAWASAWVATAGQVVWLAGLWGGAGVLAWWGRRARRSLAVAVALVVVGTSAAAWGRVAALGGDPVAVLAREKAIAHLEVQIGGQARIFDGGPTRPRTLAVAGTVLRVEGRATAWAVRAPVELWVSGDQVDAWRGIPRASTVLVVAALSPPDAGEAIAASARVRGGVQVIAEPGRMDASINAVREGLRTAASGLSPDARALVPALVVGDTSQVTPEMTDAFKATGLTHVMAVSGANVVLLLSFVRLMAVRLGVRGRVLTLFLAFVTVAFVSVCLAEPSVVRAAAMGLVGLAALSARGRGAQGLRYLGVATWALMVIDPWMSRSLGFALSATASAGLLWWAGAWTRRLSRWLPAGIAESIAVPLAAQVATQPLVTAISAKVSLVGLLANAVVAPVVGPATVCGFLAAGTSVVYLPLAELFAWLAGWCAQALASVARMGTAVPGAVWDWPVTPLTLVLLGVLTWASGLLITRALGRPVVVVLVTIALIAGLVTTPKPPGWPPRDWAVASCDVGQGDATVLNAGGGQAVVVDTGPDPALLARCLDQLGVRAVPLAVLTHLHADHVSGLPALAGRGLQRVLTSAIATPASGERLVDSLTPAAPGAAVHTVVSVGERWDAGEVRIEVVRAPLSTGSSTSGTGEAEGESAGENDASLGIRASTRGVSVLLTGDAEITGQAQLAQAGAEALKADVMLVPHHGSSRQSPDLSESVAPEIALVSVGAKNDYGHPTKKTLALFAQRTPNIVRTDQHGSIVVARVDGRLSVTAQR